MHFLWPGESDAVPAAVWCLLPLGALLCPLPRVPARACCCTLPTACQCPPVLAVHQCPLLDALQCLLVPSAFQCPVPSGADKYSLNFIPIPTCPFSYYFYKNISQVFTSRAAVAELVKVSIPKVPYLAVSKRLPL